MSAENEKVLKDFFERFEKRDLDGLMGLWAPGAVYHNMPVAPLEGVESIRTVMAGFLEIMTKAEFEWVSIGSGGDLVFTERVDRFWFANGKSVALPVAGVHEVRNGKIHAFRDYFDLRTFEDAAGIEL